MFKLSRVIAATAAVTGSAVLCGPAWAATSAKIDYSLKFTTRTPGAPSGAVERVVFTNRDDPEAKPPAPKEIVLRLPAGGRIDTGAVDRCSASDAELMAMGPAACPDKSRVGTDTLVIDTGFAANRYLTADLVFFNADHQLIILGRDRQTGAYVVTRAKVTKDSADIPFPQLPGTPPDGGAIKREHAILYRATSRRGGRLRSYITTPPACPASGHWTLSGTYTYHDDSKQTKRSPSPCARAANPGDYGRKGRGDTDYGSRAATSARLAVR
jgi:hypothetical protein